VTSNEKKRERISFSHPDGGVCKLETMAIAAPERTIPDFSISPLFNAKKDEHSCHGTPALLRKMRGRRVPYENASGIFCVSGTEREISGVFFFGHSGAAGIVSFPIRVFYVRREKCWSKYLSPGQREHFREEEWQQ
jgi:hypothetical protein